MNKNQDSEKLRKKWIREQKAIKRKEFFEKLGKGCKKGFGFFFTILKNPNFFLFACGASQAIWITHKFKGLYQKIEDNHTIVNNNVMEIHEKVNASLRPGIMNDFVKTFLTTLAVDSARQVPGFVLTRLTWFDVPSIFPGGPNKQDLSKEVEQKDKDIQELKHLMTQKDSEVENLRNQLLELGGRNRQFTEHQAELAAANKAFDQQNLFLVNQNKSLVEENRSLRNDLNNLHNQRNEQLFCFFCFFCLDYLPSD